MKSILVIALLATVAISLSEGGTLHRVRRQGLVPAEFRNINIDSYLTNSRAVLFQLKCLVYDGPCDRIGKYLKVTVPEIIKGTCSYCSASDKKTAGKLIGHIQKNYPKEWHDAIRKYQGGETIKPEDAQKFEQLLGVKIAEPAVSSTTENAQETQTTQESTDSSVAP